MSRTCLWTFPFLLWSIYPAKNGCPFILMFFSRCVSFWLFIGLLKGLMAWWKHGDPFSRAAGGQLKVMDYKVIENRLGPCGLTVHNIRSVATILKKSLTWIQRKLCNYVYVRRDLINALWFFICLVTKHHLFSILF